MANKKIRVVQAGVNTAKGNGQAVGAGYIPGSTPMPVQPKNKPWAPDWHPRNPLNQS